MERDERELLLFGPQGDGYVCVVDDGLTHTAYLHRGSDEKISSFVWLFNFEPSPAEIPWEQPGFNRSDNCKNAMRFIAQEGFEPATEAEYSALWSRAGERTVAAIYIRQRLHAIVAESDPPGWCVFAKADTPLARVLDPRDWPGFPLVQPLST